MTSRLRIVNPDPIMSYVAHGRGWLAGAVFGLVVGAGFYLTTPTEFRATSAVELSEAAPTVDLSPIGGRSRLVTVDTDAQILASDTVVDSVVRASGDPAPWVRKSVTVRARSLTRVVEITYASRSADHAKAGADAAAKAFLEVRDRMILAPVTQYLTDLEVRAASPTESDVLATASRTGAYDFRLESLRQRAVTAMLALPGPGVVLERARSSSAADRGDAEVPLASGAGLGALLGLALGLALQRLRSAHPRRGRPADPGARPGSGS